MVKGRERWQLMMIGYDGKKAAVVVKNPVVMVVVVV